jgi:hypothetical protein
LGERTDLLFGQNSRGPYRISWKGVLPYSERVVLNGKSLLREIDYTFEEASGTLLLTMPAAPKDILEVTYRIDSPSAEQNRNLPSAPLQWSLLQTGGGGLKLLVRPEALGSERPLNETLLQYKGVTRLSKNSTLTSEGYYDLRGGDFGTRGGVHITNQNQFQWGTLGISYARAGQEFAQQDLANIAKGREVWEANGAFQLSKTLRLNSVLRYASELPPADKPEQGGTVTREANTTLQNTLPGNKGTVTATRNETQTTAPDGTKNTVINDSARIEGKIDKRTEANAGIETRTETTNGTNPNNVTQTTSVGVKSTPSANVQVSGDFRTQISKGGTTDITGLRLEAKPFRRFKDLRIRAGMENRALPGGVTLNHDLMLDLPTVARTQISGGYRYSAYPTGGKMVGVLSGALRPISFFEVNGTSLWRGATTQTNAVDPSFQDGYQVNLLLKPAKTVAFSGVVGHNPDSASDMFTMRALDSRKLGLETQFGFVTFKGLYGVEEEYQQSRLTRTADLSIAMKLSQWDMLTTSYQRRSLLDGSLNTSETWFLSYSRNFNSSLRFTLRGSMTLYEQNHTPLMDRMEYRGEAQLGIRF